MSMALEGTSLNRYGYKAASDPASLNYAHEVPLPWTTQALVMADTTYAACGTASALLNMFDSIHAITGILTGNIGSAINSIESLMETGIRTAGTQQCLLDFAANPAKTTICSDAGDRLHYRQSCTESPQIASFAAGIINAINLGWQ